MAENREQALLERRFGEIGARLASLVEPGRRRFSIDVGTDGFGEHFQILKRSDADIAFEVVDVEPDLRHLLLLARDGAVKHKFLCGHDERHWFVAAVPGRPGINGVLAALEALKPDPVRLAQRREGVKPRERVRRKTAAYVRQGEWFFLPAPNLQVPSRSILRQEPLSRGNGSKPHVAEECYRLGGQTVYVCGRRPQGLLQADYERLLERSPEARNWGWRPMRRNPEVYVRGRVRHSDHKTILLDGWHRVLMNTEHEAPAMQNVAFLD